MIVEAVALDRELDAYLIIMKGRKGFFYRERDESGGVCWLARAINDKFLRLSKLAL